MTATGRGQDPAAVPPGPGPTPNDAPVVIDPDVDLLESGQRRETRPRQWDLLAAIAVGGVVGAEARYGLGVAMPHRAGEFAWSTVLINASGCLLIGILMVILLEFSTPHRLARPFFGVGILGGYTTFSTFAVDVQQLLLNHRPASALTYVVITVIACAAAVWAATGLTRTVGRRFERPAR